MSTDRPSDNRSIWMLSRISASSSIMRTDPLPLDIHNLSRKRKVQAERRSPPDIAFNGNTPAMLLHDSVTYRKSETRPLPGSLCRKEGIVDLLNVFTADASTRIRNHDLNATVHDSSTDVKDTPFGHGIASIEKEVQKYLLQLSCVSRDGRGFRKKIHTHSNTRSLER